MGLSITEKGMFKYTFRIMNSFILVILSILAKYILKLYYWKLTNLELLYFLSKWKISHYEVTLFIFYIYCLTVYFVKY